ncbi:MAG: VCBS repeat-containing protein [Planctomycetales bacterium]|nr:VCBS repeat-containing protein [Planctomycetales bacterium]
MIRTRDKFDRSLQRILACCSIVLLLLIAGCNRNKQPNMAGQAKPAASLNTVQEVVATEELIIELGPRLKRLPTIVRAKTESPSTNARDVLGLFADRVRVRDLNTPMTSDATEQWPDLDANRTTWAIAKDEIEVPSDQLTLWAPAKITDELDGHFYFIDGSFTDQNRETLKSTIGFAGTATAEDRQLSVEAKQLVTWKRTGQEWRIVEWDQTTFQTTERHELLFQNVTDEAIPDADDRRRADISKHHEILVDSYFGGKPARTPKGYFDTRFFPDSVNIHPSLSVVDIDQDGWDDLYVCVRWGANMLFRNRHDGTFEEVAAKHGLDINGRSTSATFGDFDNDGDADLMLGRSLERSQYFVNENGMFTEASSKITGGPLPFLVTSTCAVDFNLDGLLDVHFSTYSPLDITSRIRGRADTAPDWAAKFITPNEAAEVKRRFKDYHGFLGQVGPPNVLFVNRGGGRFERASESSQIKGFRNTFQATWSDFDNDGDPDLYVANDFAPDHFYRNDMPNGFTDISSQSGTQRMGFGMGAAWGDYDNDGLMDLYVSNMYSKAGRRITAKVPGLDSRMVAGSEGNYLFRNIDGAKFQRMSGLKPPALTVANAGWSWGGQFADFDNDGFLDIYVSSGFYTPPENLSNNVDL